VAAAAAAAAAQQYKEQATSIFFSDYIPLKGIYKTS
jgi:hypothetical protein